MAFSSIKHRVICQGITGKAGAFQHQGLQRITARMMVAASRRAGGRNRRRTAVFDTVIEAVEKTGANATMIFVPAAYG